MLAVHKMETNNIATLNRKAYLPARRA